MALGTPFEKIYQSLLSEKVKERTERYTLIIAIAGFLIHLFIILLAEWQLLPVHGDSELLENPISAIYTPFSFILIYEVYLSVYYLPRSITTYISKQYEIITLIIIRRLFKDMATLELTSDWFQIGDDLQFTYDLVASVLIFYLLYLFLRLQQKSTALPEGEAEESKTNRFIRFKKIMAMSLVPVLVGLALFTLGGWLVEELFGQTFITTSYVNINNIFFDEFFTLLIIVDVLLLLVSFFHTNTFYKVIRNSGFIISTVLIRLSFSVEGFLNTVLIVVAISFGVVILAIHNQFAKAFISEQ